MVDEVLKAEKVRFNDCIYAPDRDPLPVPLAGDRPRSFVPRFGGPADRLACVPRASSVWRGDRHLLRRPQWLPMAVVRRLVHETARRGEVEAAESWLWNGWRVYLLTARRSRCRTRRKTRPPSLSPGLITF